MGEQDLTTAGKAEAFTIMEMGISTMARDGAIMDGMERPIITMILIPTMGIAATSIERPL